MRTGVLSDESIHASCQEFRATPLGRVERMFYSPAVHTGVYQIKQPKYEQPVPRAKNFNAMSQSLARIISPNDVAATEVALNAQYVGDLKQKPAVVVAPVYYPKEYTDQVVRIVQTESQPDVATEVLVAQRGTQTDSQQVAAAPKGEPSSSGSPTSSPADQGTRHQAPKTPGKTKMQALSTPSSAGRTSPKHPSPRKSERGRQPKKYHQVEGHD